MNRSDFFDGFQFEYDTVVYPDIQPQAGRQANAVVFYRHVHLMLKWYALLLQLVAKACLINLLQKSWSECAMDSKSSIENLRREGFHLALNWREYVSRCHHFFLLYVVLVVSLWFERIHHDGTKSTTQQTPNLMVPVSSAFSVTSCSSCRCG